MIDLATERIRAFLLLHLISWARSTFSSLSKQTLLKTATWLGASEKLDFDVESLASPKDLNKKERMDTQ